MPIMNKQSPVVKRPAKSGGVVDRIAPIQFDADDGIKIMLYGASGSGKTTLWGTFPGPILSVVCSGGNKTGELRSLDTPENRKKVFQVTLNESSELRDLVSHVATGTYKTVVLDHASGLSDLIMKELLGLDEIPAQKSFGMASQQTYGQMAMMVKEYLRALLNLSCNVVIIAQERTFGGRDDGADPDLIKPTVGAGLTPSLASWLNSAVDYACQTYKRPKMVSIEQTVAGKKVTTTTRGKGVEYCLRTEPHDVFYTKFRKPKGKPLPECVVDPTYDKIMSLIRG